MNDPTTLKNELDKLIFGRGADELIPTFSSYIAGVGILSDIDEESLIKFVSDVIRGTYQINTAPPMKERN